MVASVFAEMAKPSPKRRFTIGIVDDVTHTSLAWDESIDIEPADRRKAVFFGLGSDGTVSANKNSIQIIGEDAGRGAGLPSTTRRRRAPSTSHLVSASPSAAWLVSNADLPRATSSPPSTGTTCLRGQDGRRLPPERALRPGRSLGSPAVRGAGPDRREEAARFRRGRVRARPRDRPRRPHQHDHAGVLLQALRCFAGRRGSRAHQEGHPQELRAARGGSPPEELRGGRRRRGGPEGSEGPRLRLDAAAHAAPVSTQAPTSSRGSRRASPEGRSSGFASRRTAAHGHGGEKGTSPDIPVWDEKLWHPVQQVRDGLRPHAAIRAVYEPFAPPAPWTFKSVDLGRPNGRATSTRSRSLEDVMGCTLHDIARRRTSRTRSTRRRHDGAGRRARAGAGELRLLLDLPEAIARSRHRGRSAQFLQSSLSGAGCGDAVHRSSPSLRRPL